MNSICRILIRKISKLASLGLTCFLLIGCSMITINTMRNDPLIHPIAATPKNKDDVFIGIALSGGGSRASNFSAAVLLELEKLGLLQQADVISSVSGGSVTAAYYGLYGNNRNAEHPWHEEAVRKALLTDLQASWIQSWFNPYNVLRYWGTNFNRSDIMIENLNDELYDNKQFKDLNKDLSAEILINATSFSNGQPFVFTDQQFAERLNSRLDTFPIANAVMASSAFPGVFQPVTLKDYSLKNNQLAHADSDAQYYEHLIDGGPYDNLGVSSIINRLRKNKPKHCLLIVIDAYPYTVAANGLLQANTRSTVDYFFDAQTVLSSTDTMLAKNRRMILSRIMNFDEEDIGFKAYQEDSGIKFSIANTKSAKAENAQTCTVWHLSFQRLYDQQFEWSYARRNVNKLQFLDRVRKIVNSIPTRYQLESTEDGNNQSTIQDYIFKAANILIKEDKECNNPDNECTNALGRDKLTYQKVCDLVTDWGLNVTKTCH
jgi:predicted acylesterase/phospholipase RssA